MLECEWSQPKSLMLTAKVQRARLGQDEASDYLTFYSQHGIVVTLLCLFLSMYRFEYVMGVVYYLKGNFKYAKIVFMKHSKLDLL